MNVRNDNDVICIYSSSSSSVLLLSDLSRSDLRFLVLSSLGSSLGLSGVDIVNNMP